MHDHMYMGSFSADYWSGLFSIARMLCTSCLATRSTQLLACGIVRESKITHINHLAAQVSKNGKYVFVLSDHIVKNRS